MWLFLLHNTTHHYQALYQISESKSSSCWEIFDRKKCPYVFYRTEGKIENLKKEGKMSISILIFIYTIHFACLKVYTKFENIGSNRSWEICDRIFLEEKEKWTNKGTDKQYVAVILLHNTTHHYQALYIISKS